MNKPKIFIECDTSRIKNVKNMTGGMTAWKERK